MGTEMEMLLEDDVGRLEVSAAVSDPQYRWRVARLAVERILRGALLFNDKEATTDAAAQRARMDIRQAAAQLAGLLDDVDEAELAEVLQMAADESTWCRLEVARGDGQAAWSASVPLRGRPAAWLLLLDLLLHRELRPGPGPAAVAAASAGEAAETAESPSAMAARTRVGSRVAPGRDWGAAAAAGVQGTVTAVDHGAGVVDVLWDGWADPRTHCLGRRDKYHVRLLDAAPASGRSLRETIEELRAKVSIQERSLAALETQVRTMRAESPGGDEAVQQMQSAEAKSPEAVEAPPASSFPNLASFWPMPEDSPEKDPRKAKLTPRERLVESILEMLRPNESKPGEAVGASPIPSGHEFRPKASGDGRQGCHNGGTEGWEQAAVPFQKRQPRLWTGDKRGDKKSLPTFPGPTLIQASSTWLIVDDLSDTGANDMLGRKIKALKMAKETRVLSSLVCSSDPSWHWGLLDAAASALEKLHCRVITFECLELVNSMPRLRRLYAAADADMYQDPRPLSPLPSHHAGALEWLRVCMPAVTLRSLLAAHAGSLREVVVGVGTWGPVPYRYPYACGDISSVFQGIAFAKLRRVVVWRSSGFCHEPLDCLKQLRALRRALPAAVGAVCSRCDPGVHEDEFHEQRAEDLMEAATKPEFLLSRKHTTHSLRREPPAEPSLDSLPDELLLRILSHVNDGEFLLGSASRVCKRWNALCREPEAWASVDLELPESAPTCKANVLLRAPTLRSLAMTQALRGASASALRRCRVVVRDYLEIVIKDSWDAEDGLDEEATEAQVLACFSSLGDLATPRALLDLLGRSRGLRTLKWTWSFHVLQTTTPTDSEGRSPVAILATMTHLTSLRLVWKGMRHSEYAGELVRGLPRLRQLVFSLRFMGPSWRRAALDLISAASPVLRVMDLRGGWEPTPGDDGFLGTLARCTRLEVLYFHHLEISPEPHRAADLAVLRNFLLCGLPASLQDLYVGVLYLAPEAGAAEDLSSVATAVQTLRDARQRLRETRPSLKVRFWHQGTAPETPQGGID